MSSASLFYFCKLDYFFETMTLCVAQIRLELGVCSPGSHQVTVSFLSQPPEYSHIVPHPFQFLSLGNRLSWVKLEDTTSDTG